MKFQKEMPGLKEVPFEGHPLGQKIYENVSQEAWKMWVEHMKMLMNEYRLNLGTAEAQTFLIEQMDNYFFGEGAALPPEPLEPRRPDRRSRRSSEHHKAPNGITHDPSLNSTHILSRSR